MYRKATIGSLSIFAVVLVAIISSYAMAQSGQSQEASPIGVWDLEGGDEANTKWIATVVLTQAKDKGVTGHIDWLGSNGHCGREYVTGTYDPTTRILKMAGTNVEFSDHVVRCTYMAELSRDGSSLVNGKWSDNDPTIPGAWSATRITLK